MINHFNIIITIKDSKTWSFILYIIFFWCVILDVFQSVSFLITNITFDFSIVARLEYIILYELYKSRCTICLSFPISSSFNCVLLRCWIVESSQLILFQTGACKWVHFSANLQARACNFTKNGFFAGNFAKLWVNLHQ